MVRCSFVPILNASGIVAFAWGMVLIIVTGFMPRAGAQLPTVSLRSLSQSFLAPGGTYEVGVAEGDHILGVDQLLFSPPELTASVLRSPAKPFEETESTRYGNFRIEVPGEFDDGYLEVRAVGRFGISNPRRILVRHGIRFAAEVSHDPAGAVPIMLSETLCRSVTPQKSDYYRIEIEKGKRYRTRLIGHSVDSRILPAVSITGENGRTIASTIGTDQADLEFFFDTQRTESIVVAVHDALFRGGKSFQYGLSIESASANGDGSRSVEARWSTDARSTAARLPCVVSWSDPPAVPVAADASIDGTELVLPTTLDGHFSPDGTVETFFCDLKKGQTLQIDVISNRMGEPTDPRLVVERAEITDNGVIWKQISHADDAAQLSDTVVRLSSHDPSLRFQVPDDGRYRVLVVNQDSGRSLSQTPRYRLVVKPVTPDFQLLAYRTFPHKDANTSKPAGSFLPRGGATVIRVFVVRRDMDSPVELRVEGLPAGVECQPAFIAANQSQADLVLTAADDALGASAMIRVLGNAEVGGGVVTREAELASVVWERDPVRPFAQTRLANAMALSVSGADTHPISVRLKNAALPLKVKKGEKCVVPIRLERREGSKDNVILRAKQTPAGVKIGDLTIAGDKAEGDWTLDVTAQAKSGTYTFWGQAETKVKFAPDPQSLERAAAYLDRLKKRRADETRADDHPELDKAITQANKEVEAIKKQTAAKDFTVYVPSPLITLVIE